jgi:hypothetical protein
MRKNTLECTIVPSVRRNHMKTKAVPCFLVKSLNGSTCNVTCIISAYNILYAQNQQVRR